MQSSRNYSRRNSQQVIYFVFFSATTDHEHYFRHAILRCFFFLYIKFPLKIPSESLF